MNKKRDNHDWARRIIARPERNENLPMLSLKFALEALAKPASQGDRAGDDSGITAEAHV